jgi:hypothetical protein
MRNAVLTLLVILAVLFGVLLQSQRRQLRALNVKLESLSRTTNLDLQEKCAKQSRGEFEKLGWGRQEAAAFMNHYNQKLNKCFMEVEHTDETGQYRSVFDAFEGKVYGLYQANARGTGVCKVTMLSGDERTCHSSEGFDSLVKQYLE